MKLVDYKCIHQSEAGIDPVVSEALNLSFPEAYCRWEDMKQIAVGMKEAKNDPYCILPFCHTVEGEALGGEVNLGNAQIGPRAKDYCCTSVHELLELPPIEFEKGRIAEVLKAARELRNEGEEVLLTVSGPFTILNVLIDPKYVFKALRKDPEVIKKVFKKLQNELLRYVTEAKAAGVRMISYADSAGGLNILGPRQFESTIKEFTHETLHEMRKIMGEGGIVILCPKTTLGLIGTGLAKWGTLHAEGAGTYQEACCKVVGKTHFVGETCIKNRGYTLAHNCIQTVELV